MGIHHRLEARLRRLLLRSAAGGGVQRGLDRGAVLLGNVGARGNRIGLGRQLSREVGKLGRALAGGLRCPHRARRAEVLQQDKADDEPLTTPTATSSHVWVAGLVSASALLIRWVTSVRGSVGSALLIFASTST